MGGVEVGGGDEIGGQRRRLAAAATTEAAAMAEAAAVAGAAGTLARGGWGANEEEMEETLDSPRPLRDWSRRSGPEPLRAVLRADPEQNPELLRAAPMWPLDLREVRNKWHAQISVKSHPIMPK
jgi:hypothetical protein